MKIISSQVYKLYGLLLTSILIAFGPVIAFCQSSINDLSFNDFAYGAEITTSEVAPLYGFSVSADIYRRVVRPDLSDMRLVNSRGDFVPFEVVAATAADVTTKNKVSLPFFPIVTDPAVGASRDNIQIARNANGETYRISIAKSSADVAISKGPSYLIDLRKIQTDISALEFEWNGDTSMQLIPVSVLVSDDLSSWRSIATSGALARFSYFGQLVDQKKIECHVNRAKYLRITLATDTDFSIAEISGEVAETSVVPPLEQKLILTGSPEKDKKGVFLFDTGGYFPVRSWRIALPDANSVVELVISSRTSEHAPWTTRGSQREYRFSLKHGEIISPPSTLSYSVTDRFWKIEVIGRDLDIGTVAPNLELNWVASTVRFVAQGDPPFKIIYGSAVATKPQFGVTGLEQLARGSSISISPASLLPQIPIQGESARIVKPESEPAAWRKIALWSLLVVFVLALGTMTIRLYKEMKASK